MDETETVVLCVCVTISQEDMILSQVSQEDMMPFYLTSISMFVWLVLITNYFRKFKPICLFKPLRKRRLSQFPKWWTEVCNENMYLNNNICLERSLRCWTS